MLFAILPYGIQVYQFLMDSKVLVNLNEFPSIFQTVQHSHSRYQETTSNLPRINLKGKFRFNSSRPLEGAMYIYFGGHPKNVSFVQFSQNIGFRQNDSQGF